MTNLTTENKMALQEMTFKGYVSEGLAQYAYNLYEMHGLNVNELNGQDYRFVQGEVNRLRALPQPISPAQKELINRLILEIRQFEPEFKVDNNMVRGLTGGKTGTVQPFINFLYEKNGQYAGLGKPSDEQINRLKEWFTCIDMPWEDLDIVVRKHYPTPTNPNAWMVVSMDEFEEQIKEKVTRDQASEFIGKHKQTYYLWKSTRLSDFQVRTIRNLEERLATLSKVGAVTYAQQPDGTVIEVYKKVERLLDNSAYEPMDEYILRQMGVQTASKYINQLEEELTRMNGSAIDDNPQQQLLEDKSVGISVERKEGKAVSEYKAITDFAFACRSVGGCDVDGLMEQIQEIYIMKGGSKAKLITEILDVINYLVDGEYATRTKVIDMAQNSKTVTNIVKALYPDVYENAVHGRVNREVVQGVKEEAPVAPQKAPETPVAVPPVAKKETLNISSYEDAVDTVFALEEELDKELEYLHELIQDVFVNKTKILSELKLAIMDLKM